MDDINKHIQELNDEISNHEEIIINLEKQKAQWSKQKADLLRNQYPEVFRIYATPDNERRMSHYVNGVFTSEELVKEKIGRGYSWDIDTDVKWSYTVKKVSSSNVDDKHFLEFFNITEKGYFPY